MTRHLDALQRPTVVPILLLSSRMLESHDPERESPLDSSGITAQYQSPHQCV